MTTRVEFARVCDSPEGLRIALGVRVRKMDLDIVLEHRLEPPGRWNTWSSNVARSPSVSMCFHTEMSAHDVSEVGALKNVHR